MINVDDNRSFCIREDCIIITCSRNPCQISNYYRNSLDWQDFSTTCGMYRSSMGWKYQPPEKDYIDE